MRARSAIVLLAGLVLLPVAAMAQPEGFSDLNSYGEWYKLPRLGWVWQPNGMAADWRPFVSGHWEWTEDGWLWESEESFGWIVCHYGNWYCSDEFGWMWVPGYDWSPARVDWVESDYEVGWAPLPPPGFRLPAAFSPEGRRHWVVVPAQQFVAPALRDHVVIRRGPAPGRPPSVLRKGPPGLPFITKMARGPVRVMTIEREEHPMGGRSFFHARAVERKGVPMREGPVIERREGNAGGEHGGAAGPRPGPGFGPVMHKKAVVQQKSDEEEPPAPQPGAKVKPLPGGEKEKNPPPGQEKKQEKGAEGQM
jgi:hypothetical protein